MIRNEDMNAERGVALIAAVMAVAVLLAIGLSFALNMRLEEKAAINYMYGLKAKYLAAAGVERAIAALKAYANDYAFYYPSSSWISSLNGSIGSDTYTVTVTDCASQIYINDGEKDLGAGNLDLMLDYLTVSGLGPVTADNIIDYRDSWPDNVLPTKDWVKEARNMSDAKYRTNNTDYSTGVGLRKFISAHAYVNPSTETDLGASDPRAPINVNTAEKEVLIAVLDPLSGVTEAEAIAVADHIIDEGYRPIRTWAEFDTCIDEALTDGHMSAGDDVTIKDNCNPNRTKPSPYTTEFCFNSGGYFEIESTGMVYDPAGNQAAEKQIRAVVKIFDIWNQTTETQFNNINKPGLSITSPGDVDVSTSFDSTCDAITGWLTESGSPSAETTEKTEGTGSIYLDGVGGAGVYKSIEAQARLILASLWIYSSDDTNDGLYIFFTDTTNNKRGPDIFMDTTGVVKYDGGGGYGATGGVGYSDETWYNMHIIADILAKTFDLYYEQGTITNATSAQATDLAFKEPTGLTQLDRITLKTVTGAADIYVDDFKIRCAGPLNTPSANDCEPGSGVVNEWGTVAWTELGSDANKGVKLQLSSAATPAPSDWLGPANSYVADFFTGDFYTEASGQSIHSVHDSTLDYIKYAASIYTIDALFTACTLYDVTITYVPDTEILYWREVTE